MKRIQVDDWTVLCNPEATRLAYQQISHALSAD